MSRHDGESVQAETADHQALLAVLQQQLRPGHQTSVSDFDILVVDVGEQRSRRY